MNKLRLLGGGLVAAALTAATAAYAIGTTSQVQISEINVLGSPTTGSAAVWVVGITGSPACVTLPPLRMYMDLTTNKGRAQLSIATAAMLAGKKVLLAGTGTCSTPTGGLSSENLDQITVLP